jgi:hypothetical protein
MMLGFVPHPDLVYSTGSFARQEAPSFALRDNVKPGPPPVAAPEAKRRRGQRAVGPRRLLGQKRCLRLFVIEPGPNGAN